MIDDDGAADRRRSFVFFSSATFSHRSHSILFRVLIFSETKGEKTDKEKTIKNECVSPLAPAAANDFAGPPFSQGLSRTAISNGRQQVDEFKLPISPPTFIHFFFKFTFISIYIYKLKSDCHPKRTTFELGLGNVFATISGYITRPFIFPRQNHRNLNTYKINYVYILQRFGFFLYLSINKNVL